jgi:sarcosine oxidase subunit alpha
MASLAGEARADLFQPIRKTPMHDWHDSNGADWEPVGGWRRVYAYVDPGETTKQAVNREVLNTRKNLGFLDASNGRFAHF